MLLGAARFVSELRFWKVQSVGNDFVLVLLDDVPGDQLSVLAQNVCRRKFSIGSDGLLAVGLDGPFVRMRMFNPDGSEDFCGNGLRCAALFAEDQGWKHGDFELLHLDRIVPARVRGVHTEGKTTGVVSTTIGRASFEPSAVPLAQGSSELFDAPLEIGSHTYIASALSTGSTHTILFVEALPDDEEIERVGPLIEHHPLFPERTSTIWTVVESDERLRVRIWERGVGETLGCGTGSSAAASAWLRRRGGGGEVEVINPGGMITVEMQAWDAPITASSVAEIVYAGRVKAS
jgi:diaminopimelate epimerase